MPLGNEYDLFILEKLNYFGKRNSMITVTTNNVLFM